MKLLVKNKELDLTHVSFAHRALQRKVKSNVVPVFLNKILTDVVVNINGTLIHRPVAGAHVRMLNRNKMRDDIW